MITESQLYKIYLGNHLEPSLMSFLSSVTPDMKLRLALFGGIAAVAALAFFGFHVGPLEGGGRADVARRVLDGAVGGWGN